MLIVVMDAALISIPAKGGLSKMKRNHIHLAQNVGTEGVISGMSSHTSVSWIISLLPCHILRSPGMRHSAKILIYVNVQKALDAGIKFWLSENGVVLTEGDERGFVMQKFFEKVVDVGTGRELNGWQVE